MPLKAWSTTWRATCSASTTISAGCSLRPERRRLPVLGQLLLEVAELGAGKQADFPQGREVLLGLGGGVDHHVGLAQRCVRAAMARIELQRARISGRGLPDDQQPRQGRGAPRGPAENLPAPLRRVRRPREEGGRVPEGVGDQALASSRLKSLSTPST